MTILQPFRRLLVTDTDGREWQTYPGTDKRPLLINDPNYVPEPIDPESANAIADAKLIHILSVAGNAVLALVIFLFVLVGILTIIGV